MEAASVYGKTSRVVIKIENGEHAGEVASIWSTKPMQQLLDQHTTYFESVEKYGRMTFCAPEKYPGDNGLFILAEKCSSFYKQNCT